ncbi:MAG: asparagine synthetase A [Candidatus Micrarchaeia archaeon]
MEKRKAYAKLTSHTLAFCANYFHGNGFTQLMPVMLSPITDPLGPDPGSSVIKTGEIEYLGQRLSLTQSMILHKQIAVQSGIDRLFILSPNVRLEHPKRRESGRHLFEFSQLDFEIAHAKMDDVFSLMEGLICGVAESTRADCAPELSRLGRALPRFAAPFPRHTTAELIARYGLDWEPAASKEHKSPFWAISHKREFYDREDPESPGTYRNYDLIYPEGFGEALSGGEREWEFDRIMSRIGRDRLGKAQFSPYIELAKGGLTPSAGGGFGIERMVRYLSGAPHVGDVQLFRRVPGEPVVV